MRKRIYSMASLAAKGSAGHGEGRTPLLCNIDAGSALLQFVRNLATGDVQDELLSYHLQGSCLLFFYKPGRDPTQASSYRQ